MLQLSLTNCSSTSELLSRAVNTAEYYGFTTMDTALRSFGARTPITRISPKEISFVHKDERPLIPLVNTCTSRGLCSTTSPVFFWKEGTTHKSGSKKSISLELHILGVSSTIAEAMLITVAQAIAKDAGLERRVVRLNSMGSYDSSARFVRELSAYMQKNSEHITESILARVPEDPLGAFLTLVEKQSPIVTRAPQSMEFLNEEERKHLAQVIEYLETSDTYYELNPFVLGSRDCWTHTLFEIHGVHSETEELFPFARGGRYDTLATRASGTPANGVGITLTFEVKGNRDPKIKSSKRVSSNDPIYFAHLGKEAKRRSLSLMELLREANIPIRQSLTYDLLSDQMEEARQLSSPYLIIMGHKEATEGNVLVRNFLTNSQEEIPTGELVSYLKRRRISI